MSSGGFKAVNAPNVAEVFFYVTITSPKITINYLILYLET